MRGNKLFISRTNNKPMSRVSTKKKKRFIVRKNVFVRLSCKKRVHSEIILKLRKTEMKGLERQEEV